MTTRREILRLASLATAAGCTVSLPRSAFAYEKSVSEDAERNHYFHAESAALRGELGSAVSRAVPRDASVSLGSQGGYSTRRTPEFRLEGVVAFKSAYSQVSGMKGIAEGQGWTTFSTSVIEGLNIADVVTADRMVAQLSTEHPLEGYVPSVSFVGTHFENLRIAGRPVNFQLDLEMIGEKPSGDIPYLSSPAFRGKVQSQSEKFSSAKFLPQTVLDRYSGYPSVTPEGEAIEFSLIHQTAGSVAGTSVGHLIQVPGFGTIHLATVKVSQSDYEGGAAKSTTVTLTMVEAQTDDDGTTGTGTITTNGPTRP